MDQAVAGKVTSDQVAKVTTDFNVLLADIVAMVPPSPRLDTAMMFLKIAESMVLVVLLQLEKGK